MIWTRKKKFMEVNIISCYVDFCNQVSFEWIKKWKRNKMKIENNVLFLNKKEMNAETQLKMSYWNLQYNVVWLYQIQCSITLIRIAISLEIVPIQSNWLKKCCMLQQNLWVFYRRIYCGCYWLLFNSSNFSVWDQLKKRLLFKQKYFIKDCFKVQECANMSLV